MLSSGCTARLRISTAVMWTGVRSLWKVSSLEEIAVKSWTERSGALAPNVECCRLLVQNKSLQAPDSFRSQKQLSSIIHRCEYVCCHRTEINFLCRQEDINTLLSNPFPMRKTGAGVILCYKGNGCIYAKTSSGEANSSLSHKRLLLAV